MRYKIAILGKTGNLGKYLSTELSSFSKLESFGRKDIDFSSIDDIKQKLSKFDIVINCIAFTKRTTSVIEDDENLESNFSVVERIIMAVSDKKIIHFSSNYVYEQADILINEKQKTIPKTYYGKTKLLGDEKIIKNHINYIIFRIAWLTCRYKGSFFEKVNNFSQGFKTANIATDDISCFTTGDMIVRAIKFVVEKNVNNEIFNICSNEPLSRYRFYETYRTIEKQKTPITRIKASDIKVDISNIINLKMSNKKISKYISFSSNEEELEKQIKGETWKQ